MVLSLSKRPRVPSVRFPDVGARPISAGLHIRAAPTRDLSPPRSGAGGDPSTEKAVDDRSQATPTRTLVLIASRRRQDGSVHGFSKRDENFDTSGDFSPMGLGVRKK